MKRACLVAFLASACASSGSAPVLLSVFEDPSLPGYVRLSWEPAGGTVNSYAIDWRVPGGTFAELVADADRSPLVYAMQLPPDSADFEFRIRAEPGARASNGVVYHRGKIAASVTAVWGPIGNAFTILYTNPSQTATQTKLERRTVQLDGAASPWSQIAVGSAKSNTYEDGDLSQWIDGARYEYRATVIDADVTPSPPFASYRAPLLAPTGTGFTPTGSGGTLFIQNNSRYARTIAIERGEAAYYTTRQVGSVAAPVAGQTTSFVDAPLSPGLHLYKLSAEGDYDTSSAPSTSWGVIEDPASGLAPRIVDLQLVVSAVRDSSGQFGIVEQLSKNSFPFGVALFPPGAEPGSAQVVNSNVLVKYLIDAAGHPHTAYYDWDGNPGVVAPVIHLWHDGSRWQREEIARRTFVTALGDGPNEIAFDIGLDGTLFAAWAGAAGIELARSIGGAAWQVEVVTAATTNVSYGELLVSGDESGIPHVIYLAFQSTHFFPDVTGWQSEPVPLSVFVTSTSFDAAAFATSGRIDLVARMYADNSIDLVQRSAAGWAAPMVLSYGSYMTAARSTDGKAVAISADDGTLRILRDGAITRSNLFPFGRPAVGLRDDGKAWVVEWLTEAGQSLQDAASPSLVVPAVIFEER
ncbi:MAG TPA: hypothetical protein VG496_16555 [Myxococcales bacterium]|nr:hypothetical protein [Myxococcales bacterium]